MQRLANASFDDAFEVTVPTGHGEHCVHRLIDVFVTSTSLLLDHSMTFSTDDSAKYTRSATNGVLVKPETVPASFFHRHTDGCSSTANKSSPADVKAMLTKFRRPPRRLPVALHDKKSYRLDG